MWNEVTGKSDNTWKRVQKGTILHDYVEGGYLIVVDRDRDYKCAHLSTGNEHFVKRKQVGGRFKVFTGTVTIKTG